MRPLRYTPHLPAGEGVIIYGDVYIGTGQAHDIIDKFGLDLGHVWYVLPKWAIFATLAASLMLLVLLVA